MSLSLRKDLHINLSSSNAWARYGDMELIVQGTQPVPHEQVAYQTQMLSHLRSLLEQLKGKVLAGAGLSITVADHICLQTTLPWQNALMSDEEMQTFSRFHLAKLGVKPDDAWLVHAEFPKFGGLGFAYALPRNFLLKCVAQVAEYHLKLQQVLPTSARIFFGGGLRVLSSSNVFLLEEEHAVSVWFVDEQGLLCWDIEPVVANELGAIRRLLARLQTKVSELSTLDYWSATATRSQDSLREIVPNLKQCKIRDRVWWVKQ